MIYAVRTVVGKENAIIDSIESKAKASAYTIKAILHPAKLKGYVLVEGEEGDIREALKGLRHAKGLISKTVTIAEIKHLTEVREMKVDVDEGDVIEVIGGPFKGESGRITKVDKAKNEVTIELLEAAVPIPITVGAESVRLIEKKKE